MSKTAPQDKLLPRITMYLFDKAKIMLLLWVLFLGFGVTTYTTLLTREGFPSINIPLAIVSGTYLVDDPAAVDRDVAKPITDRALKQGGVQAVQSRSGGNFFSVVVQYDQSVTATSAVEALKKDVAQNANIPSSAVLQYSAPYFGVTGGDTKKIDATVSFYATDKDGITTKDLAAKALAAADYLNRSKPSTVETYFVINPFEEGVNPFTGQKAVIQKTFDRYGQRENDENSYANSVIIGVTASKGADVIELDDQVRAAISTLNKQSEFAGYDAHVSASFAPSIKDQIGELQKVLLEGLLAVLVVGSVVIAFRASLITVLSMITVITMTLAFIYLIGYTLNVITLFALILSLSLIVDDTIIMVEAIDASRKHHKKARDAVNTAVRKISRAMVAATTTSVLSFAPLLFAGGVLGNFIRAIPVTIIAALIISLIVALIFIPLFARYVILGKKQMGETGVKEFAAGFEAAVARTICKPMLWARHSRKKLMSVGVTAVLTGFVFIGAAGFVFTKVVFNLFPPTKDTNALSITLSFPQGTTIQQAENIADEADALVADELGEYFVQATYFGMAGPTKATSQVDIVGYAEREPTSRELTKQLQTRFDREFTAAEVKVAQVDVGPPAAAFVVQIQTEDQTKGYELANDLAAYMRDVKLERPSGKEARFESVSVATSDLLVRNDGRLGIEVSANFDGDDTTTLVTLAQDAIKKEFDGTRIQQYGLPKDAISFDIGQESDNQDSFRTLVLAFPILLAVMYVLLAIQFRSLLQPLLIFMAVPFSLLGITLGLYLTDNAFSFFVAMGFFALIGLSIKNTILLTDYANQARHAGMGVIDSAVEALSERFRPLVATSLTAIVSLIPLAITSPFWQGLAVVLIFGLLSSTLLVVTVFPYYYLGGEFLRMRINRRTGIAWTALVIGLAYAGLRLGIGAVSILGAVVVATLVIWGVRQIASRRATLSK